MGCGVSQIRADANAKNPDAAKKCCNDDKDKHEQPPKQKTSIDARIIERLRELGTERHQSGAKPMGFDRIVMKFGIAQDCFSNLQRIYDEYYDEKKNGLDFDGLKRSLVALNAHMSEKDMMEIFYESDMVRDNSLSCNEFVVSLAISFLLGLIPSFAAASKLVTNHGTPAEEMAAADAAAAAAAAAATVKRASEGSVRASENGDNFDAEPTAKTIAKGFDLMVSAYLTFDDDASGTIQLSEVRKTMQQHGETTHHSHIKRTRSSRVTHQIRDERIKEMDVDQNGTITFQEFVLTFQKWIGCGDE